MAKTQQYTFADLEHLVRHGLEPDSPNHVKAYLSLGASSAEGLSLAHQARVYKQLLETLVEAIYDSCVPFHWRCVCLDYTYQPLGLMTSAAVTEQQKYAVLAIQQELAVLARYFLECRDTRQPPASAL